MVIDRINLQDRGMDNIGTAHVYLVTKHLSFLFLLTMIEPARDRVGTQCYSSMEVLITQKNRYIWGGVQLNLILEETP